MKKSMIQGIAIGVLISILFVAGQKHLAKSKNTSVSSLDKFEIKSGVNTEKYWKDGEKFMHQSTGPAIKSVPVEVTEEIYNSAYQAYLN